MKFFFLSTTRFGIKQFLYGAELNSNKIQLNSNKILFLLNVLSIQQQKADCWNVFTSHPQRNFFVGKELPYWTLKQSPEWKTKN